MKSRFPPRFTQESLIKHHTDYYNGQADIVSAGIWYSQDIYFFTIKLLSGKIVDGVFPENANFYVIFTTDFSFIQRIRLTRRSMPINNQLELVKSGTKFLCSTSHLARLRRAQLSKAQPRSSQESVIRVFISSTSGWAMTHNWDAR